MRLLSVCLFVALLAGCASRKETSADPATNRVEWRGHLCVQVTTPIGTKILINPYRPGTFNDSLPGSINPDVILISRETPDCTNVDVADGTPRIFRGSVGIGANNAAGVRVVGTPIYPSATGDAMNAMGMNLIYSWRSGGVKFCYIPPISRVLTSAEALQIGAVDVLFIPVSGGGLSNAQRDEIVSKLQAKLVVPIAFNSGSVNGWAASFRDVYRLPDRAFKVGAEMLQNKANPTMIIFGN